MKRRSFLKATLVAAGGLVLGGGSGCDDGDGGGGGGGGLDPSATDPARQKAYFPLSVASGDPRADSVILWTRVVDAGATGDLAVSLEVALDDAFEQPIELGGAAMMALTAFEQYDRCVKARVTGLDAGTTYYYRFRYEAGDGLVVTRTGRTKTAPAADADVTVKLAWVSCQDRRGRYYNAYKALNAEEVDVVVHLGDYVYEKSSPLDEWGGDRTVEFTDSDGAIEVGDELAAKTLSNYRELYRQYRSDEHLQRAHELFPFIVIWDDHEFANDCWGSTATDFNGRIDETDVDRRKNANQAWFEYQPVDYEDPAFAYDRGAEPPDDIRIYRDFVFGQNVHLVMTDLRAYRADHPVPEDALPGAICVEEATLTAQGGVPDYAVPYVDVDTHAGGTYATALKGYAEAGEYDAAKIAGNLSVPWINLQLEGITAGGGSPPAAIDPTGLPRGIAFHNIGKSAQYSQLGARNLVVRNAYERYCQALWDATDGAALSVMGDTQEQWFFETLQNSTASWKLWGTEFCLTHLGVDLSTVGALPPAFQNSFYVICDDWNCFPQRKWQIIEALSEIDDVVAITGDVHAFFAGTPFVDGDPDKRVVELVTAGIGSESIRGELLSIAKSDPDLAAAGAAVLASSIESLVMDKTTRASPQMAFMNSTAQGISIMEISGAEIVATMHMIDEDHVHEDVADVASVVTKAKFRVSRGETELYQELDGTWKRWDMETMAWV